MPSIRDILSGLLDGTWKSNFMTTRFRPLVSVSKDTLWITKYDERYMCMVVRTNETRGWLFIYDLMRGQKEIYARNVSLALDPELWEIECENAIEEYFDHPATPSSIELVN